MHSFSTSRLHLGVVFCLLAGGAVRAAESPAAIRAAIASHDRAVHVHDTWVRDPYIVMGPDGFYYYTGTTQRPETPRNAETKYNTGLGSTSLVGWQVPVWRSADLVEWESLGTPYTLKDAVWYTAKRVTFDGTSQNDWRVWAPELHWIGDRWALIHTTPQPLAPNVGGTLVTTAGREVKRPWTSPLGTGIGRRHDPSLFRDDDGTWWMIWGATEIAPLKADFSGYAAEPVRIGPSGVTAKMGHEGCLIQKIEGRYVLFGTGWSTGLMRKGSYNLYYATADTITGPYSERKFVGRFLGHGTPFRDREGRWWCTAFFNGNVPPVSSDGIVRRDLGADAQTINEQGLTLVPLDVRVTGGDLIIRAKDPRYATPGSDEAQSFDLPSMPHDSPATLSIDAVPGRWTAERANAWYAATPWPVGANYVPRTAINQLEMWQADTFDLATIDEELGWAAEIGMNSMRVFLHDILWEQDRAGLLTRMDEFLGIAHRHGMKILFVFFDGVWDPHPYAGHQRPPRPHIHNSGWVQSPGRDILGDASRHDALRPYVQGVLRHFKDDARVLAWDLFNEPDNRNVNAYGGIELPDKAEAAHRLLQKTFAWARDVAPSQPLTAGIWLDYDGWQRNPPIYQLMLANSDVISFHNYAGPADMAKEVADLKAVFGRPVLCTEYMARGAGSTFDPILGDLKRARVGAYNWGLVDGKSQTIYPWDTWKKVYAGEPELWHHDIFRADGSPYCQQEIDVIKQVTGR